MPLLNAATRSKRLLKLSSIWTQIAVMVASLALPLALLSNNAQAAQLTSRSVTISTSKTSATANYVIAFTTPGSTTIQSIIVNACTTPLGTCTPPTGITLSVGATQAWTGTVSTAFTRTTSGTTGNCVHATTQFCGTRTAASEAAGAKTLTLTGVTNPSTVGSFYLRITTYSDTAYATAVDSSVVAGSTANQLTVNARIQEILSFCVGTTAVDDGTTTPGTDCSAITGTTVDIGLLDPTSTNVSPVAANGGSTTNGIAMVRSNGTGGTVVTYYSEQDTSSGQLKVAGATCSGTSTTDQCINSNATQTAVVSGTEAFGMTIAAVNCVSTTAYTCSFAGGTYNLTRNTQYDGDGANTYGAGQGYAWNTTTTPATIASSAASTVKAVDDEALILKFAATPNITTPTGSYTVTSTYIATSTY